MRGYRKAGKGDEICGACKYARRRESGRYECTITAPPYYAIGRKYTCDRLVRVSEHPDATKIADLAS